MSAVDGHGLAHPHILKLHFLEIGIHPDSGKRHHRQQRRARCHLLAHLNGALRHHAVHRRHDAHMTLRDHGVAQCRFRRQHIGIVGDIGAV